MIYKVYAKIIHMAMVDFDCNVLKSVFYKIV